ncbi:efflux RND transporter periplasmic adaptor subunit [Variovorax sp. J22P168]|uniref:efflux RND transporter periplasmic adaptor subunit n=1 Tax=Variovorax jilinensis TaxID=3053513 RepID=UPI0025751CF4|nr:efflux RND transporter periplasmic adaptor subunit [Variovorax sp. J22P168]MDM0011783.1 efflux RND transporter periplasmic adaptor subunit [Variovorax sp. J22P168]
MKRTMKWAIAALVLALLVAGAMRSIGARKAEQARLAAAGSASETVVELAPGDVVRVARRELAETLPVSGTLRAVDSAQVKARVAGELTGLSVREGDTVAAGQVIARIDPIEFRSRLRQAQEQADSARSQAEVAQRTFDNNKALVAQGFISKNALETSQSNLDAALSTHRAALAAVEMTRKSLDDTVLKSPIAGQVSQRLAQSGERVGIDTKIIEVVDLSRIEVEAALAAADSVAVRVGQRATLQIEGGGVADPKSGERTVGASVVRVNPSAQAGSRSVLVYLRLDRSTGFRQGLFAQGTIDVGRTDTLALPLTAVRTDKPAPYVQMVVDGRIEHRAVEPGLRGTADGQALVAVRGLDEGAVVVAGSLGPLRQGTAVRLAPTSAPAAATVAAPSPTAAAAPSARSAP